MSTNTPLRVIRLPEVKSKTGLGRTTIYLMERDGQFPHSITLGGKAVGWIESEIDKWIEARMAARQSRPEVSTSSR